MSSSSRVRSRARSENTIELSIPFRLMRAATSGGADPGAAGDDDEELTCYICANAFCEDDACCRAMTHMACCTQPICCGCMLRSAKRCRCKTDCDAVVSLCPFCREVSPVDALETFLGSRPVCTRCCSDDVKIDMTTAVSGAPPDQEQVD